MCSIGSQDEEEEAFLHGKLSPVAGKADAGSQAPVGGHTYELSNHSDLLNAVTAGCCAHKKAWEVSALGVALGVALGSARGTCFVEAPTGLAVWLPGVRQGILNPRPTPTVTPRLLPPQQGVHSITC